MEYTINLVSTMKLTGIASNVPYVINEGENFYVQYQSIDKKKWFLYVRSINRFDYIEKYNFDLLINHYITYPTYYGEFQLPVISENMYTYTFITPSGYAQSVSKMDASELKQYSQTQRISSDEIRFR